MCVAYMIDIDLGRLLKEFIHRFVQVIAGNMLERTNSLPFPGQERFFAKKSIWLKSVVD